MDTTYIISTSTAGAQTGLVLLLCTVPTDTIGIYTIDGEDFRLPPRALFLHPDARDSFVNELMSFAVVSDMFRSPESSLAAVRAGRGARPPGFSGHNYGLSIDIDVRASWRNFSAHKGTGLNKRNLDQWMAARGWFCHRVDHRMDHEAWHYNYLGEGATISPTVGSTARYIEARIAELYGQWFELSPIRQQLALAKLHLYRGALDGLLGPISREAVRIFQRAWGLRETGKLDAKGQRTLAYVAADREIVAP